MNNTGTGPLDDSAYFDEVISSGGTGERFTSGEEQQQICDSLVQRYLRAADSTVLAALPKSFKLSPPTKPVKRLSSCAAFGQKSGASQKLSLCGTPFGPVTVPKKDFRKKMGALMDDNKVALEEQLRNVSKKLAIREKESEDLERKLKVSLSANDALESQVAELKNNRGAIGEDILARNEEARLRDSNVIRLLDSELTEKEKRLEDAVNATVEADKKILDLENNMTNLEEKISSLEEDNIFLREDSSLKTGALETKSLELEEAIRKISVLERSNNDMMEKCGVMTGKLVDSQRLAEESQEETRILKLKVKNLEKAFGSHIKEVKDLREDESKEDLASIRSKLKVVKIKEKDKNFGLRDHRRKSEADVGGKLEELRRKEQRDQRRTGEVESLKEEKVSLQQEIKRMESEVTSHEVDVARMTAKVSYLEDNVETLEIKVADSKNSLHNMSLALEEKERQRNLLEVKLDTTEDERDKLREETKKLRSDIGVKNDEINLYERKLRKAAEDFDGCKNSLFEITKKHDATVMMLEAAEESIKVIKNENLVICEKSLKETEANTKVGQEKMEAEEKLEQMERSLRAADFTVEKLSETVETKSIEMKLYQKEMERQLREIMEL